MQNHLRLKRFAINEAGKEVSQLTIIFILTPSFNPALMGYVFGFMMRRPLRRGSKSWSHVTSGLDFSSVEFEFSRLIDNSEKPNYKA